MATLKTNTLTGTSTAGSIAVTGEGNSTTTNLQQGLLKMWVQLNGTGTIATQDSFNASTLTDNGTGDQTITISTAMANATYSHTGMAGDGNTNMIAISQPQAATAVTTTATRYQTTYANGSVFDCSSINNSLFGDLA